MNKRNNGKPSPTGEAINYLVGRYMKGATFAGRSSLCDEIATALGMHRRFVWPRCVEWDRQARSLTNRNADGPAAAFPTPHNRQHRSSETTSIERQSSGISKLKYIATHAETAHDFFAKAAKQVDAEPNEEALAQITLGLVSIARGAASLAPRTRTEEAPESQGVRHLTLVTPAAD